MAKFKNTIGAEFPKYVSTSYLNVPKLQKRKIEVLKTYYG